MYGRFSIRENSTSASPSHKEEEIRTIWATSVIIPLRIKTAGGPQPKDLTNSGTHVQVAGVKQETKLISPASPPGGPKKIEKLNRD